MQALAIHPLRRRHERKWEGQYNNATKPSREGLVSPAVCRANTCHTKHLLYYRKLVGEALINMIRTPSQFVDELRPNAPIP